MIEFEVVGTHHLLIPSHLLPSIDSSHSAPSSSYAANRTSMVNNRMDPYGNMQRTSPDSQMDNIHSQMEHSTTTVGRSTFEETHVAFYGNFQGSLWNAQGLFAAKPRKRDAKWRHLWAALGHRDFAIISETHSTIANANAIKSYLQSKGYTAWWSHLGHRRAGVGIIVKNEYLTKFSSFKPECQIIKEGEAAALRLKGREGCLALSAVYMPTGSQATPENSLFDQR